MLARERSRRFSAAATGSVCARDTRPTHKETAGRRAGGRARGMVRATGSRESSGSRGKRKNRGGKRGGIETSSSAARVPLRDRGRRALFSCIRGTMGRRSRHRSLLNFLLGAASRGAARRSAVRRETTTGRAARHDATAGPSRAE